MTATPRRARSPWAISPGPTTTTSPDWPPAYIEVGDLDIFRDEAIAYAGGLASGGVPVELHVHPGAPHGFERFVPNAAVAQRAMADRARAITAI
jgi:acetyl esterase/lipase